MRTLVFVVLALYGVAAEARVGMTKQASYENGAFLAGACHDAEHLKFIEAAYNSCGASDSQWDSMYSKFKDGEKKSEQCGVDGLHVLAVTRGLASMLGGYECQ